MSCGSGCRSWRLSGGPICVSMLFLGQGQFRGHLRWAIARGSDPRMPNRELSNDCRLLELNGLLLHTFEPRAGIPFLVCLINPCYFICFTRRKASADLPACWARADPGINSRERMRLLATKLLPRGSPPPNE